MKEIQGQLYSTKELEDIVRLDRLLKESERYSNDDLKIDDSTRDKFLQANLLEREGESKWVDGPEGGEAHYYVYARTHLLADFAKEAEYTDQISRLIKWFRGRPWAILFFVIAIGVPFLTSWYQFIRLMISWFSGDTE